jgi:hypothetical protein
MMMMMMMMMMMTVMMMMMMMTVMMVMMMMMMIVLPRQARDKKAQQVGQDRLGRNDADRFLPRQARDKKTHRASAPARICGQATTIRKRKKHNPKRRKPDQKADERVVFEFKRMKHR